MPALRVFNLQTRRAVQLCTVRPDCSSAGNTHRNQAARVGFDTPSLACCACDTLRLSAGKLTSARGRGSTLSTPWPKSATLISTRGVLQTHYQRVIPHVLTALACLCLRGRVPRKLNSCWVQPATLACQSPLGVATARFPSALLLHQLSLRAVSTRPSLVRASLLSRSARIRCQNGRSCSGSRDTAFG